MATKVQNLATFFEASKINHHLTNPTLLNELVSKLPMSTRMEWTQHSITIQLYPTIRHFDEWLSGVARLVSLVAPSALLPTASTEQKSKPKNVLHAVEQRKSANKCRYCGREAHPVDDCHIFDKLDVPAKWRFLKRTGYVSLV